MNKTLSAQEKVCPDCGAPLEGSEATGFCPACLWRDLTREDSGGGESGPADALFTVPGHDVLAEIARGGGGIVYRARQREPRREVALKMLLPQQSTSDEMHARFRVETDAITRLEHRAILPVYLVGEHRGMPFFTMKLATGGTLAARRDALRGDWRAIAGLVATIADAVQFAHARGVIHRDLKPGNVLFDEIGQPYVSDFGLAKFLETDARVTRTIASFGTPAYLAPEIAEHGGTAATTATDVYGLGAILHELLCGRPPFAAESLPALLRQIAGAPSPSARRLDASVPRDLDVISQRCLAKNPAHRFASAAELAADLRRWCDGRPILSRLTGPTERLWRWARRNPALAAVSTLFIVCLLTGGAMLIDRNIDLKRSNTRALSAEHEAREQLQVSLIGEARITRRMGLIGQRTAALALLDQAAAIGPLERLRSEYIATLVRLDLTIDQRLPSVHARSDYTIDFSADLTRLLEASEDGGFVEREVGSGQVAHRFHDDPAEVWYLNYAAGGAMVTAGYRDGRMEVWDRDGAAPWWTGGGLYGLDSQPPPLAVHPTGRSIAWVAADDSVRVVDRASGAEQGAIPAAGEVRLLSFNAAGTVLLVVHRDRAIAWSWPEGKLLWSFAGRMSPARPGWSADGRRVAIGLSGRDDIAVVDARDGRAERVFAAHSVDARLLAIQPGGRLLASVGWDGRLALHDIHSGELSLEREAWVRTLRFSSDGRRIAFSSSHVELVTATFAPVDCLRELGEELVTENVACRLAVSADGRWIASADFDETRLWDARSGRLLSQTPAPPQAGPSSERDWAVVAFTAEGDALIESRRFFGVLRRPLLFSGDGGSAGFGPAGLLAPGKAADLIRIDALTGDWWIERYVTSELLVWPGGDPDRERRVVQRSGLHGPSISPDGKWVAQKLYPQNGVRILDALSGREVAALPVGQTLTATFTPDGAWLITGTGQEYRLWDTESWTPGVSWPAQIEGGSYGGTDHSPDGALLMVLQGRGALELRETKHFQVLVRLEMPQELWVNHFSWSPDGGRFYVLCSGHRVLYWDMRAIRRELAARGLNWE